MRTPTEHSIASPSRRLTAPLRRLTSLLAAAVAASACATSATAPPARLALEEGGFTLTQEIRVGVGVRADFERAVALLERRSFESGIALLLEVIEAAPNLTAAHIDLAIAYRESGDLMRAEASLERALALSPRHPVALNELGIVYRRTGRFAQARERYEQALAVYPGFHFARRNLAILCDLYLADPGCALEQYQLYVEAVPEDETAAMWIADLRNRSGR
jgi:Flp pilus assembly protein TadD